MPSLSFHFKLTLPYLADSIRFLVTINCFSVTITRLLPSLPYFCLPFLKPTPSSIVYCTCFLEVTSMFYWMWRYFTFHKETMLYRTVKISWIIHRYTHRTHTVSRRQSSSSLLTHKRINYINGLEMICEINYMSMCVICGSYSFIGCLYKIIFSHWNF